MAESSTWPWAMGMLHDGMGTLISSPARPPMALLWRSECWMQRLMDSSFWGDFVPLVERGAARLGWDFEGCLSFCVGSW